MKFKHLLWLQILLFLLYVFFSLTSDFGADLISPIHNLLAAYLIFRFQSNHKLYQFNWILLASTPFVWGIIDLFWFISAQIYGNDPSSSLVFTYLYLIPNILLLLLLIDYFTKNIKKLHRMKLFIDIIAMLIIVLGLASALIFSKLEPGSLNQSELMGLIFYSITDLFMLLMILIMINSANLKMISFNLIFSIMGFLIYIMTDLTYVYDAYIESYLANSYIDIFFLFAFLCFVISAGLPDDQEKDISLTDSFSKSSHIYNTKMVLWISLVPIILFLFRLINTTHFLTIAITIIVYQFILFYIQRAHIAELLLAQNQVIKSQLEAMVEDRTRSLTLANKTLYSKSTTDALTGLYNRTFFIETVDQLILDNHDPFSVLFLDLDRFKIINDIHGHEMGDEILKVISLRLKSLQNEQCIYARVGGDEFAIILRSTDTNVINDLCLKIIQIISAPIRFEDYQFHIEVSIGISRYPSDAVTSKQLLKYSDIAMYHAKNREQIEKYVLYSNELIKKIERRNHIELLLREADFNNDFQLFYQPKFDTHTSQLIGMEALIRWIHITEGTISPGEFIPIAEEAGMILQISDWVFETAMNQIYQWNIQYNCDLIMSMNVSPLSLDSYSFLSDLNQLITKTKVKTSWIELEITEHSAMNSALKVKELFLTISHMGIQISIDDFGTGYSSLYYIKHFAIDTLKIAKELIDAIETDPNDQLIVAAIVMMAKGMKLKTIAEGVETNHQYSALKKLGCDGIQGYLLGRPVPAQLFESLYITKAEK